MIDRIRNRLATTLDAQGSSRAIRTDGSVALGSSLGLVRKRNEDCCLVVRGSYAKTLSGDFTAAIVCDGLGGMSQGREAAVLAASAFAAHLYCSAISSWNERLARAIAYANREVYHRLHGNGGTTLSAVIVPANSDALLCHVGDSRIYALSSERVLEQLSRDDTMSALLNKREDQSDAPKDSRLLQFVGMGDEMEPQIAPIPRQAKSILLTSDGAHDVPTSVLQRLVSAAAGGNDLVRKLLVLSDMLGGRDNASAILLPLNGGADLYPMSVENELLAILPGETLSICIAPSESFERSGRLDRAPVPESPAPPPNPREIASPTTPAEVAAVPSKPEEVAPKEKPRPRKSKSRRSRTSAGSAGRLPLDEPRPEVDIQFSPLSTAKEQRKE